MEAVNAATVSLLARKKGDLAFDRAMIRTFVHAFEGRTRARRVAVAALLAHADPAELAAAHPAANASFTDAEGRPLSRVAAFVLSRAVHGALRAAVMEDADFLTSQEFEDELVRLGRGYLGYARPRG
jgi:hypothetical protein